jgi:NAD(P)-dependent dehydrogenase (short-subunit alcohol dehydrogenase family)
LLFWGETRISLKFISTKIKKQAKSPSVDFFSADLSDQAQIHELAADFKRGYERLHILVNNTGVRLMEYRKGRQGVEMAWRSIIWPVLCSPICFSMFYE